MCGVTGTVFYFSIYNGNCNSSVFCLLSSVSRPHLLLYAPRTRFTSPVLCSSYITLLSPVSQHPSRPPFSIYRPRLPFPFPFSTPVPIFHNPSPQIIILTYTTQCICVCIEVYTSLGPVKVSVNHRKWSIEWT